MQVVQSVGTVAVAPPPPLEQMREIVANEEMQASFDGSGVRVVAARSMQEKKKQKLVEKCRDL